MTTKKGSFTVKNSLDSPYHLQWPRLYQRDASCLEKIKSVFKPLQSQLKKRKSQNRKKTAKMINKTKDNSEPKSSKLRSQLAIGINEVTKGLERNQLRLAIVCKSAKPAILTTHLIPLCVSRQTPAVCLARLSETLSPVFGFSSLRAIGFKKTGKADSDVFNELVEFISSSALPLKVPWLKHRDVIEEKVAELRKDAKEEAAKFSVGNPDLCRVEGLDETTTGRLKLDETSLSLEEPVEAASKPDETGFISLILDTSLSDKAEKDLEQPAKKRKIEQERGMKSKEHKKTKYETSLSLEEPVEPAFKPDETGFISLRLDTSLGEIEKDLQPPTKKRNIEQENNKKHKKTKYQQLTVKQMKCIPNEKRQIKKKKLKQKKSK